ncbi:helix-turn-helix domain-containing protein [Amycolatopsis sp. cmx-8-4]|uniref:helix-turn-helix domain-containing protein n=1 Tax=Amycolatopsis sp. cmx-8-4 TaxID=2790947 RepID=UPI003978AA64
MDLAGRYWNRFDLLKQLERLALAAALAAKTRRATPERQGWSVADRYTPEELTAVIDLYRSGAKAADVAEAFGLSVSTVQRLIRKHGACRKDQR